MRVLQVGSSMRNDWGGIERYLAALSGGMAADGHDVVLACVPDSPLALANQTPSVPLTVAHKYDLRALTGYARLLRAGNFDLAVTHFSPDYLVPAWAARLAGFPNIVMTRHVAVPFTAARVRQYGRLYHGFVGVSKFVADVLANGGLPLKRVRFALPGIDMPTGVPPLPAGQRRQVGVFGRLVAEKGQAVALEAARSSDADWHIFGDGPDAAKLAALAGPNVTLHGAYRDLAITMSSLDVVVVPSIWDEAFGLVVVEAMAHGRAVVASRVGGIPEIVTHGTTGLLVPSQDPGALAAAVDRLTADQLAAMGVAGRIRAERYFTVGAMVESTARAYAELMA